MVTAVCHTRGVGNTAVGDALSSSGVTRLQLRTALPECNVHCGCSMSKEFVSGPTFSVRQPVSFCSHEVMYTSDGNTITELSLCRTPLRGKFDSQSAPPSSTENALVPLRNWQSVCPVRAPGTILPGVVSCSRRIHRKRALRVTMSSQASDIDLSSCCFKDDDVGASMSTDPSSLSEAALLIAEPIPPYRRNVLGMVSLQHPPPAETILTLIGTMACHSRLLGYSGEPAISQGREGATNSVIEFIPLFCCFTSFNHWDLFVSAPHPENWLDSERGRRKRLSPTEMLWERWHKHKIINQFQHLQPILFILLHIFCSNVLFCTMITGR
eukprot:m.1236977 g.1236977  ORF g.1236977 m.1236977 type:complete len:326 (-) comp24667_c1_seq24:179-1156(-)